MTDTSNRLPVLAQEIKAEHEAVKSLTAQALDRAIGIGRRLIEARDSLKHGQWLPWLAKNVGFSERTAQNYMRLARLPEAKAQSIADLGLGVADAIKSLAADERDEELEEREAKIDAADHAYLWLCKRLAEIRDQKLYRPAGFATFDEYCEQRWPWEKKAAKEMLDEWKARGHRLPSTYEPDWLDEQWQRQRPN